MIGLDGRVRLRGGCQGSIGRVAAGRHGLSVHSVPRSTAVSTKVSASWAGGLVQPQGSQSARCVAAANHMSSSRPADARGRNRALDHPRGLFRSRKSTVWGELID
jgi:hypothetical protein